MENIRINNTNELIAFIVGVVFLYGLISVSKLLKVIFDYSTTDKKLEIEKKQKEQEEANNQIKTAFNLLQNQVQRLENELIKEKELARQNVRDYENTIKGIRKEYETTINNLRKESKETAKNLRAEFEVKLEKHLEKITQLEHIIYENHLGHLLKQQPT